jgi:3-oxoacyl-[acyl-carrier protein] reductase
VLAVAADIRQREECDRLVRLAARFSTVDILVNNAGLTFTYIVPDRCTRPKQPAFWEIADDVVATVIATNYLAADQMARRVAPAMAAAGWGRIINVTTKLGTMNRAGSSPYGPSKAALEMASEIWAKDMAGTGVTVNVLNPGTGANTEGLAAEMREASRLGRSPRLIEPEEMVPPLLWLISPQADGVNGYRFDASHWDTSVPPDEAARRNGRPAGFVLHEATTLTC